MSNNEDEKKALEAMRKVASLKLKPYKDRMEEKLKKKAKVSLSDLGIEPEYLKYAAGAAKLADSLQKQELEAGIDVGEGLRLEGKMSPREKAIKLLYNKGF